MNERKAKEEPEENPAQTERAETPGGDAEEIEEGKTFAAIGYISILFLIPLLAARDNAFAQFHAKQAMVLTTGTIVAFVVLWIMWFMFAFIPVVGWVMCLIIYLVVMALCIGWLILAVMGFVKALQGEYWEMPLFADLAERISI
ncbi:MAG: DUF4870 domain-containing protein [Candidatus Coatesbacteria bacterium]|nr:MAG: DUF4870 domain-containing protein [Candidatus Coatesbacteria bacterium]